MDEHNIHMFLVLKNISVLNVIVKLYKEEEIKLKSY